MHEKIYQMSKKMRRWSGFQYYKSNSDKKRDRNATVIQTQNAQMQIQMQIHTFAAGALGVVTPSIGTPASGAAPFFVCAR